MYSMTPSSGKVAKILPLRIIDKPRPAAHGASRLAIYRWRLFELAGRCLNRMGIAGAVKDIQIDDAFTGQKITIQVGELFTRLTVDGRDYYFNRVSGKYDGTGMGCG